MGRLTLNVLLSFAQFEREVTSERIRDKIAASKRKGLWVGGTLPFGYEMKEGKIAVIEEEAELVSLPAIPGTWQRQRTATGPQRTQHPNQNQAALHGRDARRHPVRAWRAVLCAE